MVNRVLCGLLFMALFSCNKNVDLAKITDDFYRTYNDRKDHEKFMGFYSDNVVLEDIVNGDSIDGRQKLSSFFDWNNENYSALEPNTLVVFDKLFDKDKAIIQGYFSRFKWGDFEIKRMHFITILTFNKKGKIVKQVDWINYPASLVNYSNRKKSNDWLEAL